MSEQKMPALPEPDEATTADYDFPETYYGVYSRELVERIRAEAIEFGRQQERERLEPLRVAMDGYRDDPSYYWRKLVLEAARNLLEKTE